MIPRKIVLKVADSSEASETVIRYRQYLFYAEYTLLKVAKNLPDIILLSRFNILPVARPRIETAQ